MREFRTSGSFCRSGAGFSALLCSTAESRTRSRTQGNFSPRAPSTNTRPSERNECIWGKLLVFSQTTLFGNTFEMTCPPVCLRNEHHGEGHGYYKADTSMAMDTDSNPDEEGAEESQDGQDRPSPSHTHEDASVQCAPVRAVSAPCSPSGTRPGPGPAGGSGSGLDCASFQKGGERPSSLPPSSPRALAHNDWAHDSAVCPVERQHPGMQKDKAVDTKPTIHSGTTSPCALNNMKKEDGGKAEDSSLLSDQLVPDYAARLDETRNVSDGRSQTLPLPPDNCTFKKVDISLAAAENSSLLNGDKGDDISVKKEKMSQNLLQWTVADVASYFSAAGFPEQAVAFRTQEIDGKSLLLMQRSDVLTGLSIRLGPALKIYERHVKVLQRTHFLEYEDI
ncbi:sterile alpha motif domain containing 1a isoform 3-T3 [Odontesthes bonariensis]